MLVDNIARNRLESIVSPQWTLVTDQPGPFAAHSSGRNSGLTYFRRSAELPDDAPPCLGLDDWWLRASAALAVSSRIALIKVDVEGMEFDVLSSARQILQTDRPILLLEVVATHLARSEASVALLEGFLAELGYHFFTNLNKRNAVHDAFGLGRMRHLRQGGELFDILAVHADSERYPGTYRRFVATDSRLLLRRILENLLRFTSWRGATSDQ